MLHVIKSTSLGKQGPRIVHLVPGDWTPTPTPHLHLPSTYLSLVVSVWAGFGLMANLIRYLLLPALP